MARRNRLIFIAAAAALFGCSSGGSNSPNDGGEGGLPANCPQNTPDDLISDFEFDNSIKAVNGRQGGWYTYGDDVGMFDLGADKGYEIAAGGQGNPTCSPQGSLHIKGTGFAQWGAATGVDWKPRPSDGDGGYVDKMTYDASAYRGIAFWAKASETLDGVQVAFPDLYTDNAAPPHDMPADPDTGATCTDCKCIYTPGSDYNCSPFLVQFGIKGDGAVATTFAGYMNVQLNTSWQRFQVLFVDARQDPGNGGYKPPSRLLTVDKLTAMAIQVNADYSSGTAKARNFEIWIDDVSFIK
jgi:hypothetical protein